MIGQDEMFRQLVFKYAPKLGKVKKQPSYMTKKKQDRVELPLEEAISIKSDYKKMNQAYDPIEVEDYWDSWWQKEGFFHADNQSKKEKFVICLPPPNVTGYLHIGHALTIAIEDCLVRWKRMQGYEALFIPGTDHAGIATQIVVEKKLMKETGQTRHDLGREEFIKKVWEFKEEHGKRIFIQLRRVGASLDWDRQVFTMDKQLSGSVSEGFVRLFEMGLIYRENRLVNWSTILKTAISDIEVDYIDVNGRQLLEVPGYEKKVEFGVMVHFSYKLKEDPTKQLVVATTRIETMLGDVAVAVHPEDDRYKQWVGKQLIHPLLPDRKVVVIADDFVERDFGTGAVKITPAHDPNDYQCGMRHKLEFINLLTEDGKINHNGGKFFEGMPRFTCRRIIQQQLKKVGSWKDKKPHVMRLGKCSRSKDVIEPVIKQQWYIKCGEISKPMIQAVKNKELKITPPEEEKTWYRWISNLRDWCISRQLWWGHRIPAYLAWKKGGNKPDSHKTQSWIAARSEQEALEKAGKRLGIPIDEIEMERDPDVLDTWFSSGLFPFSPLKWPDTDHPDYQAFFPNSILETGHDILFFWVAKMVMMSLWLTGKLPFKETLLHPMVCDAAGQKMSKSKGNVIDPLEIIQGTGLDNLIEKIRSSNLSNGEKDKSVKNLKHEFPEGISECGSDALRFGLLAYMVQSRSINLNIKRIISYRLFCNKIWNSFKFAMAKFQHIKTLDVDLINPSKESFLNSWILAKLNKAIVQIDKSFTSYALGESANAFYNFWLYQLCDVYLEATKPIFISGSTEEKQRTALTLFICLETGMRLLHPMMPFISEELYHKLPDFKGKTRSLTIAPYPTEFKGHDEHFRKIQDMFQHVNQYAGAIRSLAASVNLPPNAKPQAFIATKESVIVQQTGLLATLAKCSKITIIQSEANAPTKGCGITNIGVNKIFLNLGPHINIQKQLARLNKKLDERRGFISALDDKMKDKNRDKMPAVLKEKQDRTMQDYLAEEKVILEAIGKMKKIQ